MNEREDGFYVRRPGIARVKKDEAAAQPTHLGDTLIGRQSKTACPVLVKLLLLIDVVGPTGLDDRCDPSKRHMVSIAPVRELGQWCAEHSGAPKKSRRFRARDFGYGFPPSHPRRG